VPQLGAVVQVKSVNHPEGVSNTAATIDRIQMIAEGFKRRPK
jgi:hypothetical protein